MSRKATHYGTCQICGSTQKLPKGVLSLHGYTTQWGFFSGICPGAENLPFEQSKDLIDKEVANVKEKIDSVESNIDTISKSKDLSKAYYKKHQPATWENRKSYYFWVPVDVVQNESGHLEVLHNNVKQDIYAVYPKHDLEALVKHLNNGYIKYLKGNIAQYQSYIEWQNKRVADWKPTELKPVE